MTLSARLVHRWVQTYSSISRLVVRSGVWHYQQLLFLTCCSFSSALKYTNVKDPSNSNPVDVNYHGQRCTLSLQLPPYDFFRIARLCFPTFVLGHSIDVADSLCQQDISSIESFAVSPVHCYVLNHQCCHYMLNVSVPFSSHCLKRNSNRQQRLKHFEFHFQLVCASGKVQSGKRPTPVTTWVSFPLLAFPKVSRCNWRSNCVHICCNSNHSKEYCVTRMCKPLSFVMSFLSIPSTSISFVTFSKTDTRLKP